MPLTQYDLIPNGLAFYKDEADFASKAPGLPAPRNPAKATKLWRDNAPVWNPFAFWNTGVEYKFFDRETIGDATSKLLLTPIDRNNPKFTSTYNLTVVNTLVEHAYLFPNGVPYLVKLSLPSDWAAELNIAGNPALPPVDFPVKDGSFVFIPSPDGKTVTAYDYQEFLAMAKPPQMSDDAKVEQIKKILAMPNLTATGKLQAILKVVTTSYPSVVIT